MPIEYHKMNENSHKQLCNSSQRLKLGWIRISVT